MLRVSLALAVAAVPVSTLLSQTWPTPAFDAPLVVQGNNSSLMIELLDAAGNGSHWALSVRIQPSTTMTFLVTNLLQMTTQTGPQLWVGYIPTVGTMEPVSTVGQLWAPDAAQETVLGVGATVQVIRNFAIVQTLTVNGAMKGVAIGDFDGDGLSDLATLVEVSPTSRELSVYRATGSSTFAVPTTLVLPANSGSLLLQAEVSGDGLADLVVVGSNVQSYRWNGSALSSVHDLFVGMQHPMPVAGDIDGDSDPDLVVFGMTDYAVLRRVGAGAFVVEAPVVGGPATHLYDVDNDGDLDGACCGGGGGPPLLAMYEPTTYRVALNNNGVFAPAYELHGIGGWHLAGITDLDGNGFKDLVAGRTIYFAQQSLGVPPHAAGPGANTTPHGVCDLDGDGDQDWSLQPDTLHWNRGDGASLATGLTLLNPLGPGVSYGPPMIPGDFDGDGDDDLIVEVLVGGVPTGSRLLLGRGGAFADGGEPFPAGTTLSPWLGTDPFPVVKADLDGDGDLDLANNSRGPALFSLLWYNNGAGSFASTPLLGFVVVACADFTADGRPDLIVSDSRLMLRRGLSNGTFSPAESLTLTAWPYFNVPGTFRPFEDSVGVADWSNDGRLDLIAAERSATGGCFPITLISTGGGVPAFVTANAPVAGINAAFPTRILAGDIDGDGHPDVVVSNPYNATTNGCAVAFGTGGFQPWDLARHQQLMVPVTALADVDADGDLDMVGSKIVRSTAFAGPTAGVRLQWGTGLAGTGGVVPVVGVRPRVAVGHPLDLRAAGVVGLTCGVLALGSSTWNLPLFGGTSYVNADVLVLVCTGGAAGAAGDGMASLPIGPLPAALARQQFYLQGAFLDGVTGWSLSNALTLRIGH